MPPIPDSTATDLSNDHEIVITRLIEAPRALDVQKVLVNVETG